MHHLSKLAIVLLFSYVCVFANAQNQQVILSDTARIYVMTMGPYQSEIYSAFGHSAFRVRDETQGIDWVYNYGVFDFDQENFYLNFARGKMLYQLGMSKYERFKQYYISENRYIVEQQLNLTQTEKQQMMDYLVRNYEPEYREYYYNYVYDNCATKIRDVVEAAFPGRVQFDLSFQEKGVSVRDLMDRYLTYQPWGDWIIDIGLGMQIDGEADARTYMFLPDYVAKAFAGASLLRDGTTVPLVSETIQVYVPEEQTIANGFFTPFNVFVVFFFVVGFFTNRDFKKQKRTQWIDPVVFTLAGLLGWWLVFLWLGTDHLSKNNLNLLWAIPLHIPLAYMLGVKKWQPFLSRYFLAVSISYLLLIVVWGFLPQPLHPAILPLVLTMMLRGFYIRYDLEKQLRSTSR